jgi:hypothetical protein
VCHEQIGAAVGGRYSAYWSYIRGSSKRRLPGAFFRLGQIDLFVHDGLHSEQNVRFEMDHAWAIFPPGGAIVVDDILPTGVSNPLWRLFLATAALRG